MLTIPTQKYETLIWPYICMTWVYIVYRSNCSSCENINYITIESLKLETIIWTAFNVWFQSISIAFLTNCLNCECISLLQIMIIGVDLGSTSITHRIIAIMGKLLSFSHLCQRAILLDRSHDDDAVPLIHNRTHSIYLMHNNRIIISNTDEHKSRKYSLLNKIAITKNKQPSAFPFLEYA